jgi:Fe-S cluster assembly protein SufD
MFINAGAPERFSAHPRLLINVGKNSKLNIIEHYGSLDTTGQPLTNTVTEIFVDAGGHCRYSKLLQAADNTVTVGGTYVRQSADSDFESHTVCVGGGLVRNDLNIRLAGPGAACRLNGAYLAHHRQHVDNHTVIEHIAPHCSSREYYKGLITGRAHAVFNGRVHIHPGAQQSNAELNNKNLLLSAMAEIDTKPELEIYADDVKCSHGATVGELDQREVFYLQSRGIEKEHARRMLSLAFINEMIEQLPYAELRDTVGTILETVLREPEEA